MASVEYTITHEKRTTKRLRSKLSHDDDDTDDYTIDGGGGGGSDALLRLYTSLWVYCRDTDIATFDNNEKNIEETRVPGNRMKANFARIQQPSTSI